MKRKKIFLSVLSLLFLSFTVSMQTYAGPFGMQRFTNFWHNIKENVQQYSRPTQLLGVAVGVGVLCFGGYAFYKFVRGSKKINQGNTGQSGTEEQSRELDRRFVVIGNSAFSRLEISKNDDQGNAGPEFDDKVIFAEDDSRCGAQEDKLLTGSSQKQEENDCQSSSSEDFYEDDGAFNEFDKFISSIIKKINQKINRENDSAALETSQIGGVEFTFLEGRNPQEIAEKLTEIVNNLPKTLTEKTKQKIEAYVAKLEEKKEALGNVMLLISDDDDDQFYQQIQQSLNHLTKVSISIDGAYEAIGFSKDQRYTYTTQNIEARCDEIGQQHKMDDVGKRARQTKFTLGDEVGKKIYDAFLGGKEHLAMLRISIAEAEQFGIDFMQLNEQLNQLKSGLEQIKKELLK